MQIKNKFWRILDFRENFTRFLIEILVGLLDTLHSPTHFEITSTEALLTLEFFQILKSNDLKRLWFNLSANPIKVVQLNTGFDTTCDVNP